MKRLPRFCTLLPLDVDGYLASTHGHVAYAQCTLLSLGACTQLEAQQID